MVRLLEDVLVELELNARVVLQTLVKYGSHGRLLPGQIVAVCTQLSVDDVVPDEVALPALLGEAQSLSELDTRSATLYVPPDRRPYESAWLWKPQFISVGSWLDVQTAKPQVYSSCALHALRHASKLVPVATVLP